MNRPIRWSTDGQRRIKIDRFRTKHHEVEREMDSLLVIVKMRESRMVTGLSKHCELQAFVLVGRF